MPLDSASSAAMKYDRAKHHILELNRQIAEFFKKGACTFVYVLDTKTSKCAIRFEQRKAIPDELGLLIGDAVHNLRSALDHLAWGVATQAGADPERVQFPFVKGAQYLEQAITNRELHLAPPKFVQAIRDLKPYPGGNDNLYGLHQLDIADKHRVIIPAVSAASLEGLTLPGLDTTTPAFRMVERLAFIGLQHEQEVMSADIRLPPRRVRRAPGGIKPKTDIGGSFHIAFQQGMPFENEPVIPVLARIGDAVETALKKLAAALAK